MCIWFPHWQIQRVLSAKPELKQRSVVLHVPTSRQGQQVLTCNARAEQIGVRPGMLLSEAVSLSGRRRQQLHVAAHDPHADLTALGELAARCEMFSPLIGIEEAESPSSLLLDVTGLQHLFQSEENLARRVIRQLTKWGYSIRLAIAETVGAACAAARCLAGENKPAIIPAGRPEVLFGLPIEGLRLDVKTLELLHQLGIRRIEHLMQLSRSSLLARFGTEVLRRLDQLVGRCDESIMRHLAPAEFQERWPLEYATTDQEVIEEIFSRLLERLTQSMHPAQRGILSLDCRLNCEGAEPLVIAVKLYQPTVDLKHLGELLRLQLERTPLSGPLGDIVLAATQTAPLTWKQQELFSTEANRRSAGLAGLIERLSNRLGSEAVVRPRVCADAVPEQACLYLPLVGQKPMSQKTKSKFTPFERPLCLLADPLAVEVISTMPDGPPRAVFYQHARYEIATYTGPERIETAWWRGPSIRRDYYRVETNAGRRFWLFRRLQDSTWFLHGEF